MGEFQPVTPNGQVAQLVERSPEKAGVGGSIPSLATTFSITYSPSDRQFHSISFQNYGARRLASSEMLNLDRWRLALDSAITADRFLVDPWLWRYQGDRPVLDLTDNADVTEAVNRYAPEENCFVRPEALLRLMSG